MESGHDLLDLSFEKTIHYTGFDANNRPTLMPTSAISPSPTSIQENKRFESGAPQKKGGYTPQPHIFWTLLKFMSFSNETRSG